MTSSVWSLGFGVSENYGSYFGSPHNKDHNMLGSRIGCHYFRKLPYTCSATLVTWDLVALIPQSTPNQNVHKAHSTGIPYVQSPKFLSYIAKTPPFKSLDPKP